MHRKARLAVSEREKRACADAAGPSSERLSPGLFSSRERQPRTPKSLYGNSASKQRRQQTGRTRPGGPDRVDWTGRTGPGGLDRAGSLPPGETAAGPSEQREPPHSLLGGSCLFNDGNMLPRRIQENHLGGRAKATPHFLIVEKKKKHEDPAHTEV